MKCQVCGKTHYGSALLTMILGLAFSMFSIYITLFPNESSGGNPNILYILLLIGIVVIFVSIAGFFGKIHFTRSSGGY